MVMERKIFDNTLNNPMEIFCNESIVKKKGVELDEKIQSISFRRYESVI